MYHGHNGYMPLPMSSQPDDKTRKISRKGKRFYRLFVHSVIAVLSGFISFSLGILSILDVAANPGPPKVSDYRLVCVTNIYVIFFMVYCMYNFENNVKSCTFYEL